MRNAMDLRLAFKEQFHAALTMFDQSVDRCPPDLWLGGTHPRRTWQIAWHAALCAHVYLCQNYESYVPWAGRQVTEGHENIWTEPGYYDPFELPEDASPIAQSDVLTYIRWIDGTVDENFDQMDLDSPESGFEWFPNMSKVSHELLNLRHLQGHVGQLSELLMARGLEIDWVSRGHDPLD